MSSSDTPKTILLRGSMNNHSERKCGPTAITPGMLIATDSQDRFVPHASAAGKASPLFARENSIVGRGFDTDYAEGETTLAWHGQAGDQFYAFLEAGANVAIGAILESNGAGALQAVTGNFGLVKALEAVNNSGGSSNARIRVEVL